MGSSSASARPKGGGGGVGWVSPAVAITSAQSRKGSSHTLYWYKLLPFLADWNAGYASGVRPKAMPASDESASTQRAQHGGRDAARPFGGPTGTGRGSSSSPFPPSGS